MKNKIIICIVGIFIPIVSGQILTTKCPTHWTKYKERCYLYPGFRHSWNSALTYCQKYGAKLVQPSGYIINEQISADFAIANPDATSFWTGYQRPDDTQADYMGTWSDGQETSVEVGVWGPDQPTSGAQQFAYVSTLDSKWYMSDPGIVRHFVCEMDTCPAGNLDRYICNGKCLTNSVVCNGINDCGNNQDENNCQGGENICSYEYDADSGTLSLPSDGSNLYEPNTACTWTIKTSPDKRIVLHIPNLETEENTDYVEIWDGGLTRSTSDLSARLSGVVTDYYFTSSYNFVTIRFVSDATVQHAAATLSWNTELECGYRRLDGYSYSNTDIEYRIKQIPSLKSAVDCKKDCDDVQTCIGFRFFVSDNNKYCHFINNLPAVQSNSGSELWIKTCPPAATVEAGIPLLAMELIATTASQQLATPFYPSPYPGNMELEYKITAPANNLITLEILYLDLCCGDNIYVYDKERDLLETLMEGSSTRIIISTGNTVYIKMDLKRHWKCKGALIQYKKGCDVTLVGSGSLNSPGYGTSKSYPNMMRCSWTLQAPTEDRSVTVRFTDFDLRDDITMITPASGQTLSYTGTSLSGVSQSEESHVIVSMATGARFNGRGFQASFSPGCQVLNTEGYVVNPQNFDFGDQVLLSCADGYVFDGEYSSQTSMALTCLSGGHWSIDNVPSCIQGRCGPAPFIQNGYIHNATGSVGGSVATYMCNTNYTLQGRASITCMADGNWDDPPQCVSTLCNNIAALATTTDPVLLLLDGMMHGSVVNLTCDTDEEIIGAQTVQCVTGQFDFTSGTNPSYCNPIPCETPVIANAVLTPDPKPTYVMGQQIVATCLDGYDMQGVPTFTCGGNDTLPECHIKSCTLDLADIIRADGSGIVQYSYGDDVIVTCADGLYLKDISTSQMVITCLHTGSWSHTPTCGKISCGVPFQVPGSRYTPHPYNDQFCYGHGCNFTFECRDRYELFGTSSLGGTTVTCGQVNDGLWDLGTLRCIGGQCPDPGYPPDGEIVGGTFQEFATVTFRCTVRDGFEPLDSLGQVSQGLTCMYNSTTGQMEWIGEMPVCKDTTRPTIFNCENGNKRYEAELLTPLIGVLDPVASDNNNLKTVEHNPQNAWLSQPFDGLTNIFWTFEDFNGNTAYCNIQVVIPAAVDCKNDESTVIPLNFDTTISIADYVEARTGAVRIVYEPEFVDVRANVSSLDTIYESEVTAFNGDSNEILDKCTVQLRFQAPLCAFWAFDIPNGIKNCIQTTCTITCNEDYYFMDEPDVTSVTMTCDNLGWNRDPPVCAESTSDYMIYTATFDYKYFVQDGVSDSTGCVSAYKPVIQEDLTQFATDMQGVCNDYSSVNPVTVTLLSERTTLSFNLGTKRVGVRFEVRITVRDETLSGSTTTKQNCANTIQTKLNTELDIQSIMNLVSVTNNEVTCGSGVYDTSSGNTQYGYSCLGYRRFKSTGRLCLNCPVGYYYDSNIQPHDCRKCPSGTYGTVSADGAMCVTCPENKNPGLEGQTDISSCDFKEACPMGYFSFDGLKPCKPCPIGFYSPEPYSRTCIPCSSDEVTYSTASTSSIDCKSLEESMTDNAVTPCTPLNPCINGGTCGFVRSDFNCTCPPGYTGRRCETIFNACSSNPCKNGKQCQTVAGSETFTCLCSTDSSQGELTGELCEIDTLGCAESFCDNNGTCHNQFQSHSCKCPTFSGFQNNDGRCGELIEPCEVEPLCQNGTCIPNGHFYKTCVCYPGYSGIYCENNIDDCVDSYCQNGATCLDGVNSFTCACAAGYHGPYCQFSKACDRRCNTHIDVNCNTCSLNNTEQCVNMNNDFTCTCKPGFTGRSCEVDDSLCRSFPCQHGGTCNPVSSTSFTCSCMQPWTGPRCETQVNNCPNGTQCYNGGTCFSTTSGYRCQCPENYIGDDCSIMYNLCERANPCEASGSNCSFSSGTFQCSCPNGFAGDYCVDKVPSCSDIVCENGGTCVETANGAQCTCMSEYTGTTCASVRDACLPNPCSGNQECLNNMGQYSCICAAGYRGQDCSKEVNDNFDYVITPVQLCREEASQASFSNGVNLIEQFTIAFWARYTSRNGQSVLLSVLGSKSGGSLIPTYPDFKLTFLPERLETYIPDTWSSRRKREIDELSYDVRIDDGKWHHIAVTWTAGLEELTIYIDGELKDQLIYTFESNIGYLVFGDFDEAAGTTNPANSFEGRVTRLYVVNSLLSESQIKSLYSRSPVSFELLLYPERTLMQLYSVDFESELAVNVDKCLTTDQNCKGLDEVATSPDLSSCPTDTLVIAERDVILNWTAPVFDGAVQEVSNYKSGDSAFDYGIYGIVYAGLNTDGNAAICSFRLFYNGVGCSEVDGTNNDCDEIDPDGFRCQESCPNDQLLVGSNSVYQTCSLYGMWDEAVKYTQYMYPSCGDTTDIRQSIILTFTAVPDSGRCEDVREHYHAAVLTNINNLNSQLDIDLCSGSCSNLLLTAVSCDGNNIVVTIDFGVLSSTVVYKGESVTTEELFRIAVADVGTFTYTNTSNNNTISPDVTSFVAPVTYGCQHGQMLSGGRCVTCGEGTEYDPSTKTCVRCPVGSYSTASNSSCITCHTSATTPTDGATSPQYCIRKCLAGQFYEIPTNPNVAVNTGTCRSCPVGYYQDLTAGTITCKPCPVGLTTDAAGSTSRSDCVTPESLTTTPLPPTEPSIGASTQESGLSVGVIVAIVLGVLIALTLSILIICFCCCKDILPCLSKKKQVVSPATKDGYYAKKYGDVNMQFVSYNLQDIREKKGKPLDRVPFVEPPLSDETGSVKTDISVHVPVFTEKMDGKVKRKSLYMSNGQALNASLQRSSGRTPRDPVMTSSPRDTYYDNEVETGGYVQPKQKRRRKKQRKDRSSSERRSRRRYEDEEPEMERVERHSGGPLPKSLAPMPNRLRSSMPPDEVILRPSSPLDQPRVKVVPSQYEDFLDQSPTRHQDKYRSPRSSRSHDREEARSRSKRRHRDEEGRERRHHHSEEYYEEDQTSFQVKRIEVESDDDLR